ncbi:hypothetical protein OH492_16465 [Vibrio chagasii]|nr:hypothetical protein [Vibrio chagasii]
MRDKTSRGRDWDVVYLLCRVVGCCSSQPLNTLMQLLDNIARFDSVVPINIRRA